MLETRQSNIEFLGKDGFQWFIAQVAPDKVWRTKNNQEFHNGFRAKIRILGYHPGENEKEGGISDENLPWAHFLVAPQFGAGNNGTGTSFALQGGEMVIGFFLDGEEAQQPVVLGAFFDNYNNEGIKSFKQALADGTTGFASLKYDTKIKNSHAFSLVEDQKIIDTASIINSSSQQRNNDIELIDTKLAYLDNKIQKVSINAGACEDAKERQSKIAKDLQEFFDKLQKWKKTKEGFVDPILGRLVDIDEELDKVSKLLSGGFSFIIRGVRKDLFTKINDKINEKVNFLSPTFLEDSLKAKKLKDGLYCAMENIIKGLQELIKKFLKELIGKLVNIPLCAAEQFMSGLLAGVTDKLQSVLGPILSGLSAFLGKAMPSIQSMMTGALSKLNAALKLLECLDEECEETYDFIINSGLDMKQVMNVQSIMDKYSTLNGSGLPNLVDNLAELTFPNAGIGTTVGSPDGSSPLSDIVKGCNVKSKKCYPPRVVIFGGGGFGAAADAVVNEIGEVVGVNMQEFGSGYTEKPFVSIVDDCDNGRGATAEAIMEDDKVINIRIGNGGSNYLAGDGIVDTEGFEVIGEVVGIKVNATGAGYQEGDLIESDSGQTLTPVIEDGRIVGANGTIDQGLSEIPALSIISDTGIGAQIAPITRFVKREAYSDPIVPQAKIITIISCPRFY